MSNEAEKELSHEEVWDDTLLIQHYDSAMEQLKQQVSVRMTSGQESMEDVEVTAESSTGVQPNNKKRKKNKKKQVEWSAGDACRCVYSADGQTYEATILTLNKNNARLCFLGYGNEESVTTNKLYKSQGAAARSLQERQATQYFEDFCEDEEEVEEGAVGGHNSSTSSRCGGRAGVAGRWRPVSPETSSDNGLPPASLPGRGKRSQPRAPMDYPPSSMLPPPPPLPPSFDGIADSEMLHTMLMSWYMTGYHTGYYKGYNATKPHQHHHSHQSSHHHHRHRPPMAARGGHHAP